MVRAELKETLAIHIELSNTNAVRPGVMVGSHPGVEISEQERILGVLRRVL